MNGQLAAGDASERRTCWFCRRRKAGGPFLVLSVYAPDDAGYRGELPIPRCRTCAVAHELDRGLGGAFLGLLAFLATSALFIRGVDPRAGFGRAMLRFVPFAGLAFVATIVAIFAGILLSRPRLWSSRPKADWDGHPDVARLRDQGFAVALVEAGPSGID
jgi:hypothetical protein